MARRVDLRSRLGFTRFQGGRYTCLAFAASAAHEAALFDDHAIVDTCEEYLYWASKQHDTPGPGTTFPAVREALVSRGQPLEVAWPYDAARDDQSPGYSPPAAAHAVQPRWTPSFAPVPATPRSLRTQLDADRVVVLGIPTWPDFDHPVSGRLSVPAGHELDNGHHAVAIVGYSEATAEMLIRNSWGDSWGEHGSAWLPLRFLDEHICDAWVIGVETTVPTGSVRSTPARYGLRD